MGDRAVRIKGEVAPPPHAYKTADATLRADETYVVVTSTAVVTITLPPAPECAGKIFTVRSTSTGDVTVVSSDGLYDTFTVLTDDEDAIALFCDGVAWFEIGAQT